MIVGCRVMLLFIASSHHIQIHFKPALIVQHTERKNLAGVCRRKRARTQKC